MRLAVLSRFSLLLGLLTGAAAASPESIRLYFHQIDSDDLSLRIHHEGSESWLGFDELQRRMAALREQGTADVRATVGPFDVHGFYDRAGLLESSRTSLELFIRRRDAPGQQVLSTQCEIRVVGSDYSDRRAEILFDIADGTSFHAGRLQVLLPLLKPDTALAVPAGHYRDLEIELFPLTQRIEDVALENIAANYSLQLGEPKVIASDDWMWATQPALEVVKSTFHPGESSPSSLSLKLRPSLLRVLIPLMRNVDDAHEQSHRRLSEGHGHTDLTLEIPFRVEPPPAQEAIVRQRIYVRFKPHWSLVGLWAAITAVICSLLVVLLRRTLGDRGLPAGRTLFAAAFVALLAYAAIFLTAELLSVQLRSGDYRTAILLGCLVGLAPRYWPELLNKLTGDVWSLLQSALGSAGEDRPEEGRDEPQDRE